MTNHEYEELPGQQLDDLQTTDDIKAFIHERLCHKENLVLGQFKLTESTLEKRGEFCGMQFVLHGPRSVKLGAVWARDTNVIYLYNAAGERYEKIQLRKQIEVNVSESRDAA